LVGKPEGKRPLGRPRRRWIDNIKKGLLEIGLSVVDWIGLVQDRYRSCELGNEPSGSIKCWETTEWLHNLWPLEWYSVPHSSKSYKLICIPFIVPYPSIYPIYTSLRMNLPSFKRALQVHNLITSSVAPLFSTSLNLQAEKKFLSVHLSLWGTGKSCKGLNLVK
jgi:hypothetical protein